MTRTEYHSLMANNQAHNASLLIVVNKLDNEYGQASSATFIQIIMSVYHRLNWFFNGLLSE